MAISEQQLETWSHQGSITQSASTYQTVKSVLHDPNAPYNQKLYDSFLQGSYGNATNIFADSDVDIAMMLTSIYYSDLSRLNETDKQHYDADRIAGSYSFNEFKTDVLFWLKKHFGDDVNVGKKAIFISGNGNRRDADVLVCVQHRTYNSYGPGNHSDYWDGITFWTSGGDKIVNYPKRHLANCTAKHQQTDSRFKKNVRVLKNMRNAMINNNFLNDGVAPSYYLEGMLWNVPGQNFVGSYQQTFENYLAWLTECNSSDLTCANGIHYLLRDGHPVCWNDADYNTFRTAAVQFWNSA